MGSISLSFVFPFKKRREAMVGADERQDAKGYLPTLDGWRGLSVMAVILYHGRSGFFPDDSLMRRLSAHGYLGVDVFFAISGFLICTSLLKEYRRKGDISLRAFYLRRCFRILPAYYLALTGICTLGALKLIPVNFADLPSCLLFYRNYRPLGMDFQGGFYTAHFWSLALEEHFYLLWPTLLLLSKPRRIGPIAFILAMVVFGWRLVDGHYHLVAALLSQHLQITQTDKRIDALLWGCLAAIYFPVIKSYVDRIRFSELWILIAAVIAAVIKLRVPDAIFFTAFFFPLLLLSTVLKPESILGRLLESPPLRRLGGISYSIYLWQELFLPQIPSENARGVLGRLQHFPWNVIAILACACLSRYLLELPMIRLGHRLTNRSTFTSHEKRLSQHLRPSPPPKHH